MTVLPVQWILVEEWYLEEIRISQKISGRLNIFKLIWFQNSHNERLIIIFLFKLTLYIYLYVNVCR